MYIVKQIENNNLAEVNEPYEYNYVEAFNEFEETKDEELQKIINSMNKNTNE